MIWNWHAQSHWVCEDYPGYEVHARARRKKNAKTVLDSFKESWVIDLKIGKTIKKFNDQGDLHVAMDKAVALVRFIIAEKKVGKGISKKSKSKLVKDYCDKHGLKYTDLPVSARPNRTIVTEETVN